jgi:competence CoiA-like predicted nuclease
MDYQEEYENLDIKLVAKRVIDNRVVHASTTTKSEGPFYCPDTFEELIVRKCIEKRDHFAYKARLSPVGSKESDLHKNCKEEILKLLQEKLPDGKWAKEREDFKSDKSKGYKNVRPDLSGRINGKGVIIEIQASTLSINKILERTEQYSKRGAYILWIVPLLEELGKDDFRPRLFERFLHSMYYGRIYYWYEGDGLHLTTVHFGTSERYIEETHWFEEDGTEKNEGGYFKPYLRVKKPSYNRKINLLTDFRFENREKFEVENEKLSVPEAKIYVDNLQKWWKDEKKASH